MSQDFNVEQARSSKIQVEVKDILQNSVGKNWAAELNVDGDGGDRHFDGDGGDRNFDGDGGDRHHQ